MSSVILQCAQILEADSVSGSPYYGSNPDMI